MKTEYAPDNTRTSIVVVLVLAAVVCLIAVLIGLSDKPQVDAIGISAGSVDAPPTAAPTFGFDVDNDDAATVEAMADDASGDVMLDETGQPFDDAGAQGAPEADEERVIIEVPTSEPTPTPAVAAAVEPTPVPDETSETTAATGDVQSAPSLPTTSGSVQGSFFTKSDENEGAIVSQNLITVSFAEDGSGAFQGVLDITYADETHILLNMSGPLTWAPTNPQVEATLAGAFTLDALIDADDVMTDDAELSISSLGAGSGSLCTTRCFGFTFPPQ